MRYFAGYSETEIADAARHFGAHGAPPVGQGARVPARDRCRSERKLAGRGRRLRMCSERMDISAATWNDVVEAARRGARSRPGARAAGSSGTGGAQPERGAGAAQAARRACDERNRRPAAALADARGARAPHDARTPHGGLGAGDRVGPYRLLRELGSGGMAEVWLAERADGAFEREVALKLPQRQPAAPRPRAALRARARHPRAARASAHRAAVRRRRRRRRPAVPGDGVRRRRADHRRTATAPARRRRRGCALFAQVLDAVQYAHANLVIHRDLKPSNILVTARRPGAAARLRHRQAARRRRAAQRDAAHAASSGRALTPDYASPEQISGEPLTIATDVYSLGVVLYELLRRRAAVPAEACSRPRSSSRRSSTADPPRPAAR